jgi:hypothetical protein
MDLDEFGRLLSRFGSGEKFTRQQILDLFSSCKAQIDQLDAHSGEIEGMSAIVETLREKLDFISRELLLQHDVNAMLAMVLRAMQSVFSEN